MAGSNTLHVNLDGVRAFPVGEPGSYLERPRVPPRRDRRCRPLARRCQRGACTLLSAAWKWDLDPHALAHLGAVDARLTGFDALLDDAEPLDGAGGAQLRTMRVRAAVESAAGDVLVRVGRALGAAPLGHDAVHARAVADLTVYLRQRHAERDLAALGRAVAAGRTDWEGA